MKIHKHECIKCGKSFKGNKYATICDDCRSAANRANARVAKFTAETSYLGKPIGMSWTVRKDYEKKLSERKTGGKLEEYKICPNFDGSSIACVSCPAEAWKFKGCGRGK